MSDWFLKTPSLTVPHGFFTRLGGVSPAPYESLNASLSSKDEWANILENRTRVARSLGVEVDGLLGLRQVHGDVTVPVTTQTELWRTGDGPDGDALVTDRPDVAVSVATADCAPVLLASKDGRIVGAAHAGWRGAAGGILESVLRQMRRLGAEGVAAVIGPCIGKDRYEVGTDMRETVTQSDGEAAAFFSPAERAGHFLFDLAGYCRSRLVRAGASSVEIVGADTLTDPRFFSYRRCTLAGGGVIGHQISAIRPAPHPAPE